MTHLKCASSFSAALVPLWLSAAQAESANHDMSLAGLRVGMTTDQAQSILGPKYHLETRTGSDPNLIVVVGLNDEKTDALVLSYAGGHLWYIKHDVDFPPGKEPTVDGFRKQLMSKFGPIKGVVMSYYTWVYGPTGNLGNDANGYFPNELSQCYPAEEQSPDIAVQAAQMARVQQNFASGCGMAASAAWRTTEANRGLINHMLVSVSDESYMYRYLTNKSKLEEQKRKQELQKANQNAAPL